MYMCVYWGAAVRQSGGYGAKGCWRAAAVLKVTAKVSTPKGPALQRQVTGGDKVPLLLLLHPVAGSHFCSHETP